MSGYLGFTAWNELLLSNTIELFMPRPRPLNALFLCSLSYTAWNELRTCNNTSYNIVVPGYGPLSTEYLR